MRWIRIDAPFGLLMVVLLLLASHPSADAQSGRFGEQADVVLVQIPVHVSRDGEPVRGLTADNFRVLEGRKKQEIVALDVYDLAALPAPSEDRPRVAVPPAARRHFVLLFDLSNSLPAGIVRAREAALDLARTGLHESDLVAVATYSQSRGAEVLMSFSTDRAQLLAALADLGLVDPFERLNDPLRLSLAEYDNSLFSDEAVTPQGGGPGGGLALSQRQFMQTQLLEQLKDLSTLSGRVTRDQAKQQIVDLSTNLDALAKLLDSVSGRKQVVLFSQGFDSDIVFGTQNTERIQEIVQSAQFGQTWRVDSEERFGASDVQGTLLSMLEGFNRSDCAVHTVDVGGLAAAGDAAEFRVGGASFDSQPLDRGHDGLFLMAEQTGGEFYRNFNDLGEAMGDLLSRTSVTYVISFRPKDVAMDGSYHPIKVKVDGVGKGIEVSHRPGYYARRSFAELSPLERQLANAQLLVAGDPGGPIAAELLAAAFPTTEPTADVLTAIEVDGASLIGGQDDNIVPAEIYTYAFDEEGQIRDFFTQAVSLDLYKVGYRLDAGFKLLGHLRLLPGSYEIRTLVRNARTGDTGVAVTDVEVPDYGAYEPALLPPFFIEPEDQWLIGHAQHQDGELDYPLMGGGKPLVPASRPRLVSDQSIPMLLVGYELPLGLEAEGHLIGANGRIYDDVSIRLDRRGQGAGPEERLTAHLVARGVAPGDYRLVVTLRGDGRQASSSLPVTFIEL